MNEKDKYRLLITRLIQETQKGTINWHSSKDNKITLAHDGEVIDKVYSCYYKSKAFRLFRYSHEAYSDDFDRFYKSSSIQLEIVDKEGASEWEFPYDNSLDDLYEAVRYKVAGVGSLIDDILGIEIISAEYGTNKKSIDITEQLIGKIKDDELHLIISNDIGGDPDKGIVKTLKIKYSYRGKVFEKEIQEGKALDIP